MENGDTQFILIDSQTNEKYERITSESSIVQKPAAGLENIELRSIMISNRRHIRLRTKSISTSLEIRFCTLPFVTHNSALRLSLNASQVDSDVRECWAAIPGTHRESRVPAPRYE